MSVKNEYRVTWSLYREWLLESKIHGVRLIFLIVWSAIFIFSCAMGFSGIFLLVGIYSIYRAVIRDYILAKRQYSLMKKNIGGGSPWLRSITIPDVGICIQEGNLTLDYQKDDIVKIKEKGEKIQLVLRSKGVIRIYRSSFVEGDWPECLAILKQTEVLHPSAP